MGTFSHPHPGAPDLERNPVLTPGSQLPPTGATGLDLSQGTGTRNTPGVGWSWCWPTSLRAAGTTPLPVALLTTVRARGIGGWDAAILHCAPADRTGGRSAVFSATGDGLP